MEKKNTGKDPTHTLWHKYVILHGTFFPTHTCQVSAISLWSAAFGVLIHFIQLLPVCFYEYRNQNGKQVSELFLVLHEDCTRNAILRLSNEWICGSSEVKYKYHFFNLSTHCGIAGRCTHKRFCTLSVIRQTIHFHCELKQQSWAQNIWPWLSLNNHGGQIFELRQKQPADSTPALIWQTATMACLQQGRKVLQEKMEEMGSRRRAAPAKINENSWLLRQKEKCKATFWQVWGNQSSFLLWGFFFLHTLTDKGLRGSQHLCTENWGWCNAAVMNSAAHWSSALSLSSFRTQKLKHTYVHTHTCIACSYLQGLNAEERCLYTIATTPASPNLTLAICCLC